MKKHSLYALVLLLAMVLAACGGADNTKTVTLDALNGSGETGTATLTDMGNNQTKVELEVKGAPAGVVQPVHIHNGSCGPTLNPVPKYPLTSLVDGKSTTIVPVALSALTASPFAVNAHKSAQQIKIYVTCGNIK